MQSRLLTGPKFNPKREPYAYFFDRVGHEPIQHRLISIPEKVTFSQTLVAGVATAIPRSEMELYDGMNFVDKVNFVRAFLLTDDIQGYLSKIYRETPEDIERIGMHISGDFLRSDPRYEFAFFAIHLFLGIQIAQKHISLNQRVQTTSNPYCLNIIEIRQALLRWVPLSIFESSMLGTERSRFPLRAILINVSPVFDTVHRMGSVMEEKVNTLMKGHGMSAIWRAQVSTFNPGDLPEALLVNSETRPDIAVTEAEMVSFIGLLSSTNLACYTGIMKQLIGRGLWPLWYEMLRKKPLLLAEAQKLPNCPNHLLVDRNPLRYGLEQVIGGKVPERFFALKPLKIESPFSAIDTPKKVVHVLQPIDGDRYEARGRTPLERELEKKRAELNLRITNILNGAEKVSPGKLEQLKQEEREISVRLRQIVSKIPDFLSAQDIRTIEQQKKEDKHREKHIDIDVDGINWNAPRKSQATNIDFSSCEIPEGVSVVLTCETPYGETRILAQVIFPLSDSLLKIPHIQEMYEGGKFHYTVTFSCPPGKEFAIDTTQMVRRFSTDYVNAQLTPDEMRMEERATEMLKFKLKRQKKLQIKLQKIQERQKKKLSGKKISEPIQRVQLSEYDGDMLVLGIILETFQDEVKPEIQEGALMYNLTQYLSQLGEGYILHGDYSRVTVKEGIISPPVDSVTAELLYVLAERDKPSQNDGADSDSEDQPDPEYLAFRAELQPIFDCLNGYKFKKEERGAHRGNPSKERGADLGNPFPSLNESLGVYHARIYMAREGDSITLKLDDIQCSLIYNREQNTFTRTRHSKSVPGMRDLGGKIKPEKLTSAQRRAIHDLEELLKSLHFFCFATRDKQDKIIDAREEALLLCGIFEQSLANGDARVMYVVKDNQEEGEKSTANDGAHVSFLEREGQEEEGTTESNLFPMDELPTVIEDIKSREQLETLCTQAPEGMICMLMYAKEAIEFRGERRRKEARTAREESLLEEDRNQRLMSLRKSPRGRELLKIRLEKTLQGSPRGSLMIGSQAYKILKGVLRVPKLTEEHKSIPVDDAFIDKYIDALIAEKASVSYRRPIMVTLEQHNTTLQKLQATKRTETAPTTASQ